MKSFRKNSGIIFCILLLSFVVFHANAQVRITDVSAVRGKNGDVITISGNGFTTISKVYMGSIALTTNYSALTGKLTASIPKGISYDRISVTNTGAVTAQSDIFFTMYSTKFCAFNAFNFDTVKVMETGIATANIALEDVDKDGLKDLLQLSTGKLTIYKNTSSSAGVSFKQYAINSLIAAAIPSAIVIYDLNSDGNLDAIIGYRTGNQISILTGLSTGGFSADPTNITVGNLPRTIAAGDLDNDGIAEIIAGNAKDQSLSILKYYVVKGVGAYKGAKTITGITAASIAIADMDKEGNKDIIIADGTSGYFLPNLKDFTFDKPQELTSEATSLVSAGDYNADKNADVLFPVSKGIYSTFNNSIAEDTKLSAAPIAMTALDINFDGSPDLATLYKDPNTGTNNIAFFENDLKNFTSPTLPLIYETGVSGNVNLVSADLDGDSQGDLVTYDAKGYIYIYHKSNEVNLFNITATPVCQGQNAPVSAETNNGAFVWYADDKTTVIDKQPATNIPAKYLKSLTNTVYVQVQSGTCYSDLRPVTINVNKLPDATASAKFPYLCQNDFSILLSVDAGGKRTGSAYNYQWSSTTDITSSTLDSTKVTPADTKFITGTGSAGQFPSEKTTIYTYNLTVTDPKTLCVKTSSVAVNVYSYAAALKSSADVICSGDNVSFTASINNGTFLGNTFTWTNNSNAVNPKDGVITATLNPVNTTTAASTLTYTISGKTAMGCPVSASKSISIRAPQVITPSSLPRTIINSGPYTQVFKTSSGSNATFKMVQIKDPLPLSSEFSFTGNTFSGKPTIPYKGTFLITSTETGQCPGSAQYTFIVDDLADPNLIVFPMYKNVGDQPFFIQPITQSAGEITYSFKNASDAKTGCVTIGDKGFVTISCAASKDSIPVIVEQAATAKYKKSTIETFIKVSPNKDTKVLLATSGVVAGEDTTALKYYTNSDADKSTIEFVQLNNTDLAEIKPDGTIIPGTQTGTVDVEIRIPATLNYAAVSRTFTITVYAAVQKPIVSTDTVMITVGQDTIINILENDLGVTRAIDPAQTDIDMENNGVQNKYYSLTMGNFLIDLNGNLQIKPFSGFIGEGKLGYTVTDSAGVKSEIGYVLIKVVPLTVTPPLKANEIMTPNSDGYNDGLVIAYANLNPHNSLTIMDESGNVIYETSNYQNDWTGVNKKGKPVEAGVYYYVYKEADSGRELIQYIQVVR